MMNLHKLTLVLLPLFCGSVLLTAHLPDFQDEERDPIGIRALSESEMIASEEWRAAQFEALLEDEKEAIGESRNDLSSECNSAFSDILKADYSAKDVTSYPKAAIVNNIIGFSNYPGIFHNSVGFSGHKIGFEDGSWWTICSKDLSATRNWMTTANSYAPDAIVITQNLDWPTYSSYRYYLTNQQTGVSVKANLSLAPIKYGSYTRYISSSEWLIDQAGYFYVQLRLNDGSIWNMLSTDFSTTSLWFIDDTVIIGVNGGISAAYAPNILINIATDNHSAGTCIRN